MSAGYVMHLGQVPYQEAWGLQRSLAAALSQGRIPDTVLFLEHPPVITLGRRTEDGELHVPEGADVEIVETDRGGKSTYHGPGQLVCYPILDLTRHGQDVKRYCRDLEETLIRTMAPLGLEATRIQGLTGIWLTPPRYASWNDASEGGGRQIGSAAPGRVTQDRPRKIASIGVHISKWVTTHGYALNVDLDPAPFTEWITACGIEDAAFTTIAYELARPVAVDEIRPFAAAAIAAVFDLELEEVSAGDAMAASSQPLNELVSRAL
jgi:lipoyl(octanoyl) transferase